MFASQRPSRRRASPGWLCTPSRRTALSQIRAQAAANDVAVRRALEVAGIEFIDENGDGPGIRLRNDSKKARPLSLSMMERASEPPAPLEHRPQLVRLHLICARHLWWTPVSFPDAAFNEAPRAQVDQARSSNGATRISTVARHADG